MEMTFELAGREIDNLSKRLMKQNESVDPRETLKLCLILESLWEAMGKARNDLVGMMVTGHTKKSP